MLSKTSVRFAILFMWSFFFPSWFYVSKGVLEDYLDLLNHADLVQVSIITLWLPVGFFGVLLYLLFLTPKAFVRGEKIKEIYRSQTIKLWDKIVTIFALCGIAFAVAWTYHSIDLLEKYGYEYSRDLTRITPTGIHLMYVKAR
ncbi:TPA: hypothetical protein ACVU5J_004938 [Vibrio parahaemolyticus]|uniref:Uncharacterized protein n=1 Tax=Vibrio parahaemolyticus TaxID=670 RepID=A0A9Q3UGL7_VIBPH|nr:hypothetical protein [Vibrio parahaemolyticus]MCC3807542.1 hypothetical protein [Vibrio parahaemolyticus]